MGSEVKECLPPSIMKGLMELFDNMMKESRWNDQFPIIFFPILSGDILSI